MCGKSFCKKEQKKSKIFRLKHRCFRRHLQFFFVAGGAEEEKEGEKGGECAFALSIYAQKTMSVRRRCYYHHHRVLLLVKLAFVVLFLCAEDESNERRATLFVSGAKPSPRGKGGKGKDSIGLEELKTKLSIAESAIAKVTQELVARGEDIGEKKKIMMKGGGESEEEKEEEEEEKTTTTTRKELNTFPVGDR